MISRSCEERAMSRSQSRLLDLEPQPRRTAALFRGCCHRACVSTNRSHNSIIGSLARIQSKAGAPVPGTGAPAAKDC
jgi:hypothetical protein